MELTRRSILKALGLGTASLLSPLPLLAKEDIQKEHIFNFKNFNEWLQTLQKSVKENKMNSFQIFKRQDSFNVIGRFDYFVDNLQEGSDSVPIAFQIETSRVPANFLEEVSDKDGRCTFVKWLYHNRFVSRKIVDFVNVCRNTRAFPEPKKEITFWTWECPKCYKRWSAKSKLSKELCSFCSSPARRLSPMEIYVG